MSAPDSSPAPAARLLLIMVPGQQSVVGPCTGLACFGEEPISQLGSTQQPSGTNLEAPESGGAGQAEKRKQAVFRVVAKI